MGEADMETGSPLMFMCQLAQDCCHAFTFSTDDERGHLLRELRRLLELMSFSKDPFLWDIARASEDIDVIWKLVDRLARMALGLFAWPVAQPSISCAVLLAEWSFRA